MLKKITTVLVLALLLAGIACTGVFGALTLPKSTGYFVNDFAGILSSQTEATVEGISMELEQKTGAQLVVVMIDSLQGVPINDFANALFREWGIGQKDKNNGVLLLIAPNERSTRIEVGYGLEGRLTDGKTGRIQDDYLIPYLLEGDYDRGVLETAKVLAAEIAAEYGVELTGVPESPYSDDGGIEISLPILVIIFIIFDLVFLKGRTTRFIFQVIFYSNIFGGRGGSGYPCR